MLYTTRYNTFQYYILIIHNKISTFSWINFSFYLIILCRRGNAFQLLHERSVRYQATLADPRVIHGITCIITTTMPAYYTMQCHARVCTRFYLHGELIVIFLFEFNKIIHSHLFKYFYYFYIFTYIIIYNNDSI